MRTAVAIRHVHFEDLGSFAVPIEAAGYKLRYLDPGIDELRPQDVDAADLLVVLGGPVAAYEGHLYPILDEELELLQGRLATGQSRRGRQQTEGAWPSNGTCQPARRGLNRY